MQNSTQRSTNLHQTLAYEARLNRLHRIFKTHFNVTEPSMVMEPYLFLGNCISAHDVNRLSRLGIRFILNVAIRDVELCPYYSRDMRTLTIDLRDDDRENILRTFDQAFAFIDEARRTNSRILVHCSHGQSRSPAIVIAYLMRSYHVSLEQCLMHVVKARPCVIPNDGFLKQLILYDRFLVERRRQQQQEELARKQQTVNTVLAETPIQHHQMVTSVESVQTSVPSVTLISATSSASSDSSNTHLTSVDSSSVELSSVSSIQSTSSASSIHVVPIEISRTIQKESKPIAQAAKAIESTKSVEKIQEKEVIKSMATKPTLDISSKNQTKRSNHRVKKHFESTSIRVTRSNTNDMIKDDVHIYHSQTETPLILSAQQWNFIDQYPFDSHERAPTKYITEIYDRATNRFIPTTCCY